MKTVIDNYDSFTHALMNYLGPQIFGPTDIWATQTQRLKWFGMKES